MNDRLLKLVVTLLIIGGMLIAALFMLVRIPRMMIREGMATVAKKEQHIDLSALVTQIRDLSRLETTSMRVVNVSRIDQSYGAIPDKLAGDSITFLAVGDVIAGIDLSQITREDVYLDREGVLVMKLPLPEILVTRLDNKESKVITRDTGMLRRADVNLESRLRQQAESSVRDEALRKGILPLAATNAEVKLSGFLNTVGFQRVRFESRLVTPEHPR
ncbi:MAG TPA: DUF4230 domain-containing protein [Thermoanaerobaculia bacterium]|nr:DUF4230 domain-containing protein [Thermoanaerobaculia bacterium]